MASESESDLHIRTIGIGQESAHKHIQLRRNTFHCCWDWELSSIIIITTIIINMIINLNIIITLNIIIITTCCCLSESPCNDEVDKQPDIAQSPRRWSGRCWKLWRSIREVFYGLVWGTNLRTLQGDTPPQEIQSCHFKITFRDSRLLSGRWQVLVLEWWQRIILPIFPILRWSPCTEGYPVEGVVYVGEDVEEVGGVELACQRNFHFCK